MGLTSRCFRAVDWLAGIMEELEGGGEGKVEREAGNGQDITAPKGEKVDWWRGVGWRVREGVRREGGMLEDVP